MGTGSTGMGTGEQLPSDQTATTPSQIAPSQSQVYAALAEKIAQIEIELPDSLTTEQKVAIQQSIQKSITEFLLNELGGMDTGLT